MEKIILGTIDPELEVNLEVHDLLPNFLYGRTSRKGNGWQLLFSKQPFNHARGEEFFQTAIYHMAELFIVGSSFKLNFGDRFRKQAQQLGKEESSYKGKSKKHFGLY